MAVAWEVESEVRFSPVAFEVPVWQLLAFELGFALAETTPVVIDCCGYSYTLAV